MDVAEMESHIHCIEKEAYSNVLRAFIAQSDVLSWGKEELISELRKELRVSDVEHRELLAKVNSDDSVKMIRDWRKGTVRDKEILPLVPNSMVHNTHKRPKTSHTPVPISQSYLQSTQHTPAVIPSSAAMNFRDGQRSGEVAMFTSKDNADQSMKSVYDSRQTSIVGKGARQPMVLSNMANQPPDLKNSEKESNIIKIRATDQLIREVERVISGEAQINQQEVAKAKLILKEHEQAILEALDKLANILDDDDTPGHSQHWHTYEGQQQRNGHQLGMHQPYLGRSISFAG